MNNLQTKALVEGVDPVASPKPTVADKADALFHSILFEKTDSRIRAEQEPEFFRDLNLGQVVDAVTAGKEEYKLKPFFYGWLTDLPAVTYRHEVMHDLENAQLFQSIKSFSGRMRVMREHLAAAKKLSYKYQKERWFVDAVEVYGKAVESLRNDLDDCEPCSRGLLSFRDYLVRYTEGTQFKTLFQEARQLRADLSAIKYCLLIRGNSITVCDYAFEIDYSAVIEEAFARFKQGAVKDYRTEIPAHTDMNHVEAQVLELVAKRNPDVFLALDEYCSRNEGYPDRKILEFDREIQFYIAWVEFTEKFKTAGLKFCYPKISDSSKEVRSRDGFDLALASKLISENAKVVCNDFHLVGEERILIVTGPNQGGKTTFARTFGQLHYLAALGLTIAGSAAQLFLFDKLFTHFEKQEDITSLRGKLQDDLIRIHHILENATHNSVIVINEIFSSTTLQDAAYLGKEVIERIAQVETLCVCVTFLDELASLNERTVSIVATVPPDNPTLRTYKLERRPADGLSYARALAEKHGLTYEHLKERLKQ